MTTIPHSPILDTIAQATGEAAKLAGTRGVGGGSINRTELYRLEDGRRFFVKSHASPPPYFFECEAQGLAALADAGTLRVPRVVAIGAPPRDASFLVLEAIDEGTPSEDFFERLGRGLARLHRETSAEQFGFERDNFIGTTTQTNRWHDDWCEFWRVRRLGFQFDLARRKGLADPELDRLGEHLLDRLDEFLAEPDEPPCLLHGDLWSGNFMCDEDGGPVIVDPAVYYGRREADLAMTKLFGGFDTRFDAAYEENWPLAPGAGERLEIYKLYHLLNHLNLFGGGYRSSCLEILRRFA